MLVLSLVKLSAALVGIAVEELSGLHVALEDILAPFRGIGDLSILVVFLAAYSLVMDFESIKAGVENGAPRNFAWQAAFGIVVTVVWLYVEILRILAILRGE